MSLRLAAQSGMTNQWLKDQGLISSQRTVGEDSLPGYGPVTLRTAWCGPACQVVWGLGVKTPGYPIERFAFLDYFIV
jgi:hypothetical protein